MDGEWGGTWRERERGRARAREKTKKTKQTDRNGKKLPRYRTKCTPTVELYYPLDTHAIDTFLRGYRNTGLGQAYVDVLTRTPVLYIQYGTKRQYTALYLQCIRLAHFHFQLVVKVLNLPDHLPHQLILSRCDGIKQKTQRGSEMHGI